MSFAAAVAGAGVVAVVGSAVGAASAAAAVAVAVAGGINAGKRGWQGGDGIVWKKKSGSRAGCDATAIPSSEFYCIVHGHEGRCRWWGWEKRENAGTRV